MTPEEIKNAARMCAVRLTADMHPNLKKALIPLQLNEKFKQERRVPLDYGFKHLLWMCEQVEWMVDEGKEEKANRWLGFIQGALWFAEKASIDEMREWNLGTEAG